MSSMFRKIMRNVRKIGAKRTSLNGSVAVGSHRAGMHQQSEHEWQRSRMADGVPEPETVEEGLEMPAELESEIPPEEDEAAETEMVAEGEISVTPEAEILEEIADPEASVNEEEESALVNDNLSVDYSAERIPVLEPILSGGNASPDTPLVYSSQDGSVKEIQEPLPGLGEKFGIPPVINGMEDPSANVAAAPEPEPEPAEPAEPAE